MKAPWRIWLGFIPYIVVCVIHVGTRFSNNNTVADATKLWLMPMLVLAVLTASIQLTRLGLANRWQSARSVWLLLTLGLVFSWLGDGAGTLFPFAPTLPLMLLFFGVAHMCYIRLFWRHLALRPPSWWILFFAFWWVILLLILWPRAQGLTPAIAAYGLVLGGTAALSTRCNLLVLCGGMFFLASDTILAFRIFALELMPDWTSGMVMLTYTIGQGLIAAGTVIALSRASRDKVGQR
ncbi:hypothetical protein MB46_08425 [Arthrobacter alpinus]|nr:hypothetical protein MB46_08425 [Arthrobacter alpinus]